MADLKTIASDPDFISLPQEEQIKALREIEPAIGGLPMGEQLKALQDLRGSSGPSDDERAAMLKKQMGVYAPRPAEPQKELPAPEWAGKYPNLYGAAGATRETLGPIVEALGMGGGELLGFGSGGPGGAVLGAGLGYSGARQLTGAADEFLGNKAPSLLPQALKQAVSDAGTGAAMAMGGPILSKGISTAVGFAGKGIKELLGASTGSGPGMAENAINSGESTGFHTIGDRAKQIKDLIAGNEVSSSPKTQFIDGMRGKITGNEIVDNATSALNSLKEQRASVYVKRLEDISKNQVPIDTTSVDNKLNQLLKNYRVGKTVQGTEGLSKIENPQIRSQVEQAMNKNNPISLDFSGSAIGKSAQKDVKEMVDLVTGWKDKTPLGIDALKRRLGDFYSESSQARQFVASLKNEVSDTLKRSVPEYATMTKGYEEASNLIKDIESSLMLRKSSMSGRITADQTLRRLSSSMRENFEMRRDLVNILGEKGGQDLAGQISGYSASQIIPRGLVGKAMGTYAGYFTYFNPKFWPVLLASSPRAAGEFLNLYGKGLVEAKTMAPATYKALAFGAGKLGESDKNKIKDMLTP
jgi:hypothetical protein